MFFGDTNRRLLTNPQPEPGILMNLVTNLPHPEAALKAITEILKQVELPKENDKRISVRKQVMKPIVVQPCDNELNPIGKAIEGLSRDVSVSGIGFLVTEPIRTPCVSIQFVQSLKNDPAHNDASQIDMTASDEGQSDTIYAEVVHQSQRGPVHVVGSKIMVNWEG